MTTPRRIRLPHSSLDVFPLCMGIPDIGVKAPEEEGHRRLDHFLELGGNFIDTARIYSDWVPGEIGRSERVFGDWIQSRGARKEVIIATKGGHPPLSDMTQTRLSEHEIASDVQKSLEALRTDHIDLYWLHRDDPARPVADIVQTMDGLVRRNLIRHWGVSNWRAPRIREAVAYARAQGLEAPIASQPLWNIGSRYKIPAKDPTMAAFDAEHFAVHQELDLTCLPYASQAGGFFSKLHARGGDLSAMKGSGYATAENAEVYRRMVELASRRDVPLSHLPVAWLRAQPIPVVPVFSASSKEQLLDTIAALDLALSRDEADWLCPSNV